MTLPRAPLPWIEVAAATRLPKSEFWTKSALGQSVQRIGADMRVSSFISFENRSGLPGFYNQRIETEGPDVLVFAHDDVWLDDYHFAQRVLGMAPVPRQVEHGRSSAMGKKACW